MTSLTDPAVSSVARPTEDTQDHPKLVSVTIDGRVAVTMLVV